MRRVWPYEPERRLIMIDPERRVQATSGQLDRYDLVAGDVTSQRRATQSSTTSTSETQAIMRYDCSEA
jgi:hypothetical protein